MSTAAPETGPQAAESIAGVPNGPDGRAGAADAGFNWAAAIWAMILVPVASIFLAGLYLEAREQRQAAGMRIFVLGVESGAAEIAYQALLASGGDDRAFDRLADLAARTGRDVSSLDPRAWERYGSRATAALGAMAGDWSRLGPLVEVLAAGRGVIRSTLAQADAVKRLVPELAVRADRQAGRLIRGGASPELVGQGTRQRFLALRIGSDVDRFVAGGAGWRRAAARMQDDVHRFGQINDDLRGRGDVAVAGEAAGMDPAYRQLVSGVAGIAGNAVDYIAMLDAAARIGGLTASLRNQAARAIRELDGGPRRPEWMRDLPWMLASAGLVGLIGLIWSLVAYARRRQAAGALPEGRSKGAVARLLDGWDSLARGDLTVEPAADDEVPGVVADAMNAAIGELRSRIGAIRSLSREAAAATGHADRLVNEMLAGHGARTEGIVNAARDIERISEAADRISQSAVRSSKHAKALDRSAREGAAALRGSVGGMNAAGGRVPDTGERLKRLAEGARQVDGIDSLVREVAEQANVLSLNASIQAAKAGEEGRGFLVIADEAKHLAECAEEVSGSITGTARAIRRDAENALRSMETAAGEVTAGAGASGRAEQALDGTERSVRELLAAVEILATQAAEESGVADRVSRDMQDLRRTAEQSDIDVSQVAASLGQARGSLERLDEAVSGFRLPE